MAPNLTQRLRNNKAISHKWGHYEVLCQSTPDLIKTDQTESESERAFLPCNYAYTQGICLGDRSFQHRQDR